MQQIERLVPKNTLNIQKKYNFLEFSGLSAFHSADQKHWCFNPILPYSFIAFDWSFDGGNQTWVSEKVVCEFEDKIKILAVFRVFDANSTFWYSRDAGIIERQVEREVFSERLYFLAPEKLE